MLQLILGFVIGVICGVCAMGLVAGGSLTEVDYGKCKRCPFYKVKNEIDGLCDKCPNMTEGKL